MKNLLKNHISFFCLMVFLCANFNLASAQGQKSKEKSKVTIKNADKWQSFERYGKNVQRLIGHVVAIQDSVIFRSDSAFLNTKNQDLTAYNNIHIQVNDSVNIYGDSLFYNGQSKIAYLHGDVKLTDPSTILTTDYLIYNRNNKIASYTTGGKILNNQNILTSKIGDYLTNYSEVHFKDSVRLNNPKYVMVSDTLNYNTQTEVVTFTGPTTITGENNFISARSGQYDTKSDLSILSKDALVINKDNTIQGDSIFYNALIGLAEVFDNVTIQDTANQLSIKGNFADYQKLLGYAYVTDSAFAVAVDKGDSLYLHADTLYTVFDSIQQVKKVTAYPEVRFFRHDFQGVCDSLIYSFADSSITFYKKPILWTGQNQISSPDSIKLLMANGSLDSLFIYNDAFIVSRDSTDSYNQIRGKNMIGLFHENDLRKIRVIGNAQTIYFARDESKILSGINKSASSDMTIFLVDNRLKSITYERKPDGTMFPVLDLPRSDWFLKGFMWHEGLRPKDKKDIFRKTNSSQPLNMEDALEKAMTNKALEDTTKRVQEENQIELKPSSK